MICPMIIQSSTETFSIEIVVILLKINLRAQSDIWDVSFLIESKGTYEITAALQFTCCGSSINEFY